MVVWLAGAQHGLPSQTMNCVFTHLQNELIQTSAIYTVSRSRKRLTPNSQDLDYPQKRAVSPLSSCPLSLG